MNIRASTIDDILQLKHLWKICFGDDDEYIDFYFEHCFRGNNAVVTEIDHKVVGVVHLLQATYGVKTVVYGYAIGVLPEYRGNNICKFMLDLLKAYVQKNDMIFALHPANEKLASFYQTIGLSPLYKLKRVIVAPSAHHETFRFEDIRFEDFCKLRVQTYQNAVAWDKTMLKYMFDEIKFTGGFVKSIMVNGATHYLLGKKIDDTLYIKETTMSDDEILQTSSFLKKQYCVSDLEFVLPGTSMLKGVVETTVLGYGEENDAVYMNLFLD